MCKGVVSLLGEGGTEMVIDRLGKIKEVLRQEDLLGWQVFDCESTVGDIRATVYDEDGIQVKVSDHSSA